MRILLLAKSRILKGSFFPFGDLQSYFASLRPIYEGGRRRNLRGSRLIFEIVAKASADNCPKKEENPQAAQIWLWF
jgi:hypothetical protein